MHKLFNAYSFCLCFELDFIFMISAFMLILVKVLSSVLVLLLLFSNVSSFYSFLFLF